ncbi:MAG: hypothetical protein HOM96_03410 [Rickettsiales bacterium]|jgi:hypothetical protein|nr:hypothetical protein [Rickettsiales bacterium]
MDIENILGFKNVSPKKIQEISAQKQNMQKELVKIDDFCGRLEYATYIINNIFNIINDKSVLTFKEYKDFAKLSKFSKKKQKNIKKTKKYKGWKK